MDRRLAPVGIIIEVGARPRNQLPRPSRDPTNSTRRPHQAPATVQPNPPFAAADIIRQARRYKSRREITRALRLIADADLALRSNPPSKRVILEQLVLALASPLKLLSPTWQQEELPV